MTRDSSDTRSSTEAADGPTVASATEEPTEPTSDPVLEVTNVEHAYGSVEVLDDVSLSIPVGAMTALIGPNGSGKTTLLRIVARLLRPSWGTRRYNGPAVPREIGYLPQHPSFRPGFSVAETLEFYGALVGEAPAVTAERLETVGLEAAAGRPADALSGGMTRLLGIAQATVGDPPLVVLDEPASGLDPGMRAHVFEVMTELAATGTAVVVSSHDLELVERHADTIALLEQGELIATGSPETVLEAYDADSLYDAFETATAGESGRVAVRGESR